MACLFGHKWDGCKCTKCGKSRDEGHQWNGCKCEKCGKIRDEGHQLNGCKCIRCEKNVHEIEGLKCKHCGEICITVNRMFTAEETAFITVALMTAKVFLADKDIANLSEWNETALSKFKEALSNDAILTKDDMTALNGCIMIYDNCIDQLVGISQRPKQRMWCSALTAKLASVTILFNPDIGEPKEFFTQFNNDEQELCRKLLSYEIVNVGVKDAVNTRQLTQYKQRLEEVLQLFETKPKTIDYGDAVLIQYTLWRMSVRVLENDSTANSFMDSQNIDMAVLEKMMSFI